MKRLSSMILLSAVVAVLVAGLLPAPLSAAEGTIRVLLTTGGHGFEAEPFYAAFDAMPDVEYTKAELPKDADLLKPGLEKQYDCIVMYDMVPKITPDQQKAFAKLLETGIGATFLIELPDRAVR